MNEKDDANPLFISITTYAIKAHYFLFFGARHAGEVCLPPHIIIPLNLNSMNQTGKINMKSHVREVPTET